MLAFEELIHLLRCFVFQWRLERDYSGDVYKHDFSNDIVNQR